MDKQTIIFLEQTAKDYDMNFEDVKRIYTIYPYEEFYENLELFIQNRHDMDGCGKI